jgi:macrocin-O-methyltransferase TylF-like protien
MLHHKRRNNILVQYFAQETVTLKRRIYGAVAPAAFPVLSIAYQKIGTLPPVLMELAGIGDRVMHPHLATIYRIVDSLPVSASTIAECGVYQGNSLFAIAHRLRFRRMHTRVLGFDSFEGLPEPSQQDGDIAREGSFNDTRYEEVARKAERLGFDNITLVKGYFERTLSRYSNESFGLVHLDVDLFESYRTCLEFFYPRMVPGGYIVCDEYGGLKYPGAKIAIDSFLKDKPERLETFEDLRNPRPFIRRQCALAPLPKGEAAKTGQEHA